MNWWKSLKGKVRLEEPLRKHTTFKIGGPAKFFVEPRDLRDLKLAVSWAKKNKTPVFLLGAGSNILAPDKGIRGIVLRLSSPYFKKISRKNNFLETGGAVSLGQLMRYATDHGLSGVEFLSGIPGTVGGALSMNAGAWGNDMGNIVERVTAMDYSGKIKILPKKDIIFGYRKSSLSKYIILSCAIILAKKNKQEIKDDIKKYMKFRLNSQDNFYPNAGCIFKNPTKRKDRPACAAGRLIDLCSLKNKRVGKAYVSQKHANFIINKSDAKAGDVLKLMRLIQARVKQEFNINLEPEIKVWK